ncbi:recombinase family protein [uncultured Secundilactobacillus sp.]|uniref:recombinase family protein n=1 Tax=uncultured Secundilactobacillus sp. TaxID=2813935 RepID=UPI0025843D83|nr:recombinase family protein [uncultured Secundilactobacillus sp.]
MMKVGYARVSTQTQNLARQLEALKKAQVEKIFQEKMSGKNQDRPELIKLLNFIREGDEVVVLDLDRLGRNMNDIKNILESIKNKGATTSILNLPSFEGINDPNLRSLLNSLIIDLYSYIAQNERESILQRQREGIAVAKNKGLYKGRPIKYSADAKNPHDRYIYQQIVTRLTNRQNGERVSVTQIANELGIARKTIYNIKHRLKEVGTYQDEVRN